MKNIIKLKKKDVVYDLGAFNGRHTLLYSRAVGSKGLVVSVEPSYINYVKLLHAITEYRLTNVVALNVGILDESGRDMFNITEDYDGAANTFFTDVNIAKKQLTPIMTLDQITDILKVKKINFIKSDIEGAEIEAFMGAANTLGITDSLAIGSYHIRDNATTASRVENILISNGFSVVTEAGDIEQGYTDEIVTYGNKK